MVNSVSDFINLVQTLDETRFSADTTQYASALAAILDATSDQGLLDRYRRALTNAAAWVLGEDGEDSPRAIPIQTLLSAVEILQRTALGHRDLDVHALAAMVKGRAHAGEVLRALLHRPLAPKDLLQTLELEPAQLHRVLRWAGSSGLIERSGVARDVVYSISRLGETALRGTDEPAWVQTAAMLLQLQIESRIRKYSEARTRAEVTQLTGLTAAEAERVLIAFASALNPSVSSALAGALGGAHSRAEVLLEADVSTSGKATALVSRALERAGIDNSSVDWWESPGDAGNRAFREIVLSRSVLCVRNPSQSDLGAEILEAFGALVTFNRGVLGLRARRNTGAESWRLSREADFGVVARFYSPRRGASHFVVGGLEDEGTVAAARVFYERIESFLDARPDTSFAAIVRARPGSEPEILGELHTLFTEDPYVPGRTAPSQQPQDELIRGVEEQLSSCLVEASARQFAAEATMGVFNWAARKIPAHRRRPRPTSRDADQEISNRHFPATEAKYVRDLPLAAQEGGHHEDVAEPEIRQGGAWTDRG